MIPTTVVGSQSLWLEITVMSDNSFSGNTSGVGMRSVRVERRTVWCGVKWSERKLEWIETKKKKKKLTYHERQTDCMYSTEWGYFVWSWQKV